jgi:hypothetical protein
MILEIKIDRPRYIKLEKIAKSKIRPIPEKNPKPIKLIDFSLSTKSLINNFMWEFLKIEFL